MFHLTAETKNSWTKEVFPGKEHIDHIRSDYRHCRSDFSLRAAGRGQDVDTLYGVDCVVIAGYAYGCERRSRYLAGRSGRIGNYIFDNLGSNSIWAGRTSATTFAYSVTYVLHAQRKL